MEEKSTQISKKSVHKSDSQPQPSKRALAFIRQFARVYQVMPGITSSLSGFVAN